MASYPGAALGAFGVGIIESFASFQSSTLKDVIVFSLLIPVLLWRSLASQHSEEGSRGMTLQQIRLIIAAAIACLVAAPFVLNPFSITLLNYIGIYALAAIGWRC